MSQPNSEALGSLLHRESAAIVAATGLVYRWLSFVSPNRPLRQILQSWRGGIWGEESIPGRGSPVLRSTNMRGPRVDVADAAWRIVPDAQAVDCSLRSGDILVTKSSGSFDLVGKATLFVQPPDDRSYLFSNFTLRLRPDTTQVHPAYLAWLLRSPQALSWRYEAQQNAVGLRNLQTDIYLRQQFPIPPMELQRAVADYLDTIEAGVLPVALVASMAKVHEAVGRIHEVAGKIKEAKRLRVDAEIETSALFQRRLSDLMETGSRSWARETIADVIVSMESGWSPQCEEVPAEPECWGVLKTTAVQWCEFRSEENKALPLSLAPRPHLVVQHGDVLVTRAGPMKRVGVPAAVPADHPKLMISDKIIRLRPRLDVISPRFLELAIASPLAQDHLLHRKTGLADAQVNISQQILRTTPLTVPSLPTQIEIVQELDALQASLIEIAETQSHSSKRMEALLPALLDKAFRDEL